MTRPTIGLVPFASASQTLALTSLLDTLGDSPLQISPQDWLDTATTGRFPTPLLLFFGQLDYPAERVRVALRAQRAFSMAIFRTDGAGFDSEIAATCNDFLLWPCARQELVTRLKRVRGINHDSLGGIDESALLEEFAGLNLVGGSASFVAALKLIKRIARCDVPVLIKGETGTGKELAARAIHYLGARRDHPFIPLNCGAVPDSLFESELFGHERGAFTDAKTTQPGVVALAEGGTLFLDEVDALSAKGQVVLLRYLQDQQHRPLGSSVLRRGNTRIIAATNADLAELAKQGCFRSDLLYRLNVTSVSLPPLRERDGDTLLLADHFIARYRHQYNHPNLRLHPESARWIVQHTWPGNVRELENLLHREFLLTDGQELRLGVSESQTQAERRTGLTDRRKRLSTDLGLKHAKRQHLEAFEKRYLETLLAETAGNISQASRLAGTERRALGKLLKRHGVDRRAFLRR